MAEVIGELDSQSTYGEQQTCKLLGLNLPRTFTVYVESPIQIDRDIRYPDFVVVTDYGFIILEVKDWILVTRSDPQHGTIRTRGGEERQEMNPVTKAREYGFALTKALNKRWPGDLDHTKIPWSYAAILFNLTPANLSSVRSTWGEDFVLGKADLENPDILRARLRETIPSDRMRPLTRPELDHLRATIFPIAEFKPQDRDPVVLDLPQEKIVAEPVRLPEPAAQPVPATPIEIQRDFLEEEQPEAELGDMPEAGKKLLRSMNIRLVRGFSGSGKTLVMIQRAKYLAALNPDWNIGILTFNKNLQEDLQNYFTGTGIEPKTFHGLCFKLAGVKAEKEVKLEEWLETNAMRHPAILRIGKKTVENEIKWLRDTGVSSLEDYLAAERKGTGGAARFDDTSRRDTYAILESYRRHLAERGCWDYDSLWELALRKLEADPGYRKYDALLIDEAQDWAPAWFRVVNRILKPETGILFMADDPSQSIYRYFSWKEKGVSVVGRTRWLKVPYRNTYEIYNAAYSLIDSYPEIQAALQEEGEKVTPEISPAAMRSGPKPLVRKFATVQAEKDYLRETVDQLHSQGYRGRQVAILVPHRDGLNNLRSRFNPTDVCLETIHSFKGLEAEVVIIPFINQTFLDPARETAERRLLYMGMSRARTQLLLTCTGRLPKPFQAMVDQAMVETA